MWPDQHRRYKTCCEPRRRSSDLHVTIPRIPLLPLGLCIYLLHFCSFASLQYSWISQTILSGTFYTLNLYIYYIFYHDVSICSPRYEQTIRKPNQCQTPDWTAVSCAPLFPPILVPWFADPVHFRLIPLMATVGLGMLNLRIRML